MPAAAGACSGPYFVGNRDAECANFFMDDLRFRIDGRMQLTTDGHGVYLNAVAGAFDGAVDYAMLVKLYGEAEKGASAEKRYSPAVCTGAERAVASIMGKRSDAKA